MKVLHIINSLNVGGAEVLLKDTLLLLNTKGIHSDVYILSKTDSFLEQELLRQNITVFSSNNGSVYSMTHVKPILKLIPKYDLVHVHLFPAQLFVALAKKLSKSNVPLVTTEHSTFNRRRKPQYWLLDFLMYKNYNGVICISDAVRESLLRWQPSLRHKTVIVENGIDVERFNIKKGEHPFQKDDNHIYVASVGRFFAEKDQSTLIRAIAKNDLFKLVLIGEGPLQVELTELCTKLNIRDRVIFLGKRDDVPSVLKHVDIYVQPSIWEGFGIATVEAMSSGLPVIISDIPGLREIVGECGILFKVGDSEELYGKLMLLANDRELREKMACLSKQRARKYDIRSTVVSLIEKYSKILGDLRG